MTTITSELIEVLNDLIKINYDRIEGYRKAAEETKTYDIFSKAINALLSFLAQRGVFVLLFI